MTVRMKNDSVWPIVDEVLHRFVGTVSPDVFVRMRREAFDEFE
jgi:hypothetical protein